MSECPASSVVQATAKDSHFFVAPSQNLRCAGQQKGREQQIEPTEGIQGTQILVTVSQTPSGGLHMGHWRCFTFKSLQLSHSIPTTPPASPMHTPTSWLAPYQCSQQWWGWVLQLVSKHTNFCFTEYAKGLCGSQQTVENSSRDGNTRPPYLPPVKPVCRSRSNS